MGTIFAVTLYAPDDETAKGGFEAAFARAEEINQAASDYMAESDVTKFNAAPADEWIPVSQDLVKMVAYGLELADLTNGSYDPTLGTVTHLWRETREARVLPSPETLKEALAHTGWEKVQVDQKNNQLMKSDPLVRIDLGGIGKGYAADEMLTALEQKGIRSALVAAGGDVRCGQAPPDKTGWTIGLKDQFGEVSQTLTVTNCAVSTSGDLNQFVEIEGKRYSHIINPIIGLGLDQPIMATVVAPRGQMTDPLATAACVNPIFFAGLSPSTDIHSRIIQADEVKTSAGFPTVVPIALAEEEAPAAASEPEASGNSQTPDVPVLPSANTAPDELNEGAPGEVAPSE